MTDADVDEEPLDPRIQHELERLNKASLLINRLENDLDVQIQAYQSATNYERAMSMQAAAREMVELAEQGYFSNKPSFDTAWQEMLNHATIKVMDAEKERVISEGENQRTAKLYADVQQEVNTQYMNHKRSISKSKPYYELKANFHTSLENQKQVIEKLQSDINSTKSLYSKALSNLEAISEDIHKSRREKEACKALGTRESGVGSESPTPPPCDQSKATKNNNIDYKQEAEIIISFPPVRSETKSNRKLTPLISQSAAVCSSTTTISASSTATNTTTASTTTSTSSSTSDNTASDTTTTTVSAGTTTASDTNTTTVSDTNTTTVGAGTDCTEEMIDTSLRDIDQPVAFPEIKITVFPSTQLTSNLPVTDGTADKVDNSLSLENDTSIITNGIYTLETGKSESPCSSKSASPVAMRHRRVLSGSIKLSAKRLLQESSSIDSDSSSVHSFAVLDDEGVKSAMSNQYFDGSYEEELRRSTHEDYSTLPDSLAHYQKPNVKLLSSDCTDYENIICCYTLTLRTLLLLYADSKNTAAAVR
ncbi:SH3BP5L [Bugula neritina]|uniref:SH3BP5L n=1 Tax=Bugula neritina TaxID=10212 RepID=A0A7J7KKC3_BUGNE|nr:SH3BP5L [Bugula neritina]